jgi:hypothetical protein
MKTRMFAVVLSVLAVWAVGRTNLVASDPVGVYAVVEKVVLEPNDTAPERVQIWGAFSLADTRNNDDYAAPQKGYLYYACPSGQARTCANEWADLKSVAGKATGVGFGGRFVAAGHIRKVSEQPSAPDAYPIRMGVIRMSGNTYHSGIVAKLKASLAEK